MAERWLSVPGFEADYEVSDQGRIRSWRHWNGRPSPRMLKPSPDKDGYRQISLCRDGVAAVKRKMHLLVLLTFVGPRPEGSETRHLNNDRSDNALTNLAYGTRSANIQDAVRAGTHSEVRKTHCPAGHPYDRENTYSEPGRKHRHCRACNRARRRRSGAAA